LWGELHHPEFKALSIAEMLEQEQAQMMPMTPAFDSYAEKSVKVSGTCLVNVQRNCYSVPCEYSGLWVSKSGLSESDQYCGR
jgi:hypothetical protein